MVLKLYDLAGGTEPNFADYIIFAAFMWVVSISSIQLLNTEDSIYAWRDRLLNAFDGYARNAVDHKSANGLT